MTRQTKGTATAILRDEEVLRRRDKNSFDDGFQAGIDFGKEVNAELLAACKDALRLLEEMGHKDLVTAIDLRTTIAKAEGA